MMNLNQDEKIVYLTMTYDYLEGSLPEGWSNVKAIWLDANQCGLSEIDAPFDIGYFTVESKPWKPNFEGGKIVAALAHVQDGAISVEIIASNNTQLCTSVPKYGETPAYIFQGTLSGQDKIVKEHISSMPGCAVENFQVKELARGQSWKIKAHYDYDLRPANMEGGKRASVGLQ
jgi:hypothetical protein